MHQKGMTLMHACGNAKGEYGYNIETYEYSKNGILEDLAD